ncbi:Crp/Fnr family transcriptional regulator [Antarctobacter sp.]|uniref:Crp/Fnr family transcriptional regulator n=1 Tax=Antarctobacter sp. TaxID=1872577 RepID=UPI002B2777DE|nr:Crp/Fnr family transcriptional regulator [Antarctobacter sp.]
METLRSICTLRRYSAGQSIADAGEEPGFVGCVQTGVLRMQKTLQDGRQHIVGLLVEGDMFGRVLGGPLDVAIEAATDAEVCAFRRAPFEALLAQSPELDRLVLLSILHELDRARDWLIILGSPRVRERLAGFLLVLCTRFATVDHLLRTSNGALDVKVPINRTDLAHLLGTRPESISRAFHALADTGCITIRKPDLIGIQDLEALATEAGEDEMMGRATLKTLLTSLQTRVS